MGFFRIWTFFRRKSITFVMIHGVMDEEEVSDWAPFRSYLSRKNLEESMRILSKYYRFISIDQAVEILEGKKKLIQNACVMTFDDGQSNNITHAMPILHRYNSPAILYLVTGQIDLQEPFWFDRLDYAMQQAIRERIQLKVFGKSLDLVGGNHQELKKSFLRIKSILMNSGYTDAEIRKEILSISQELESISGKSLVDIYNNDPWSRILSWSEVQKYKDDPYITFGSHTVDHTLLGKTTEDDIVYQIVKSKDQIEQYTQKACVHFCYPNGSLHPSAPKLLKDSGYISAVTTSPGLNDILKTNKYYIMRYNMPTEGGALNSLAVISGFTSVLRKCKQILKDHG